MRFIFLTLSIFLYIQSGIADNNFTVSSRYKNSISSVYYSFSNQSGYNYNTQYRYGLYDEAKDKFILPMKYKSIRASNEENIFFLKDTIDNWGVYNIKTNSFLTKFEFKEINQFSEGLAIVTKKNDKGVLQYGALDITGKVVIPIKYLYLGSFSEGYICFKKDKGYGYMNKNEEVFIPAIYRSPANFSEGLACVSLLDSTNYGYIDKKNKWVIPPTYLRGKGFVGNFAVVFTYRNYTLGADRGGVIDKTGKLIVPLKYDNITITDNFFIVNEIVKDGYLTNKKYGIIDSKGNTILPNEYDDISKKYGTYYYQTKKNNKYRLVDKYGKFITEEQDYIASFTNYNISYLRKDNKYTIIDKNLKTILPERNATYVIFGTKDRFAILFDDKLEIYNPSGNLIQTIKQENSNSFSTAFKNNDDSIKVNYDRIILLYNIKTKSKQILDYKDVGEFNENGIFIAKNSLYDFLDYTGKKINSQSYNSVTNFSDGIAAVQLTAYSLIDIVNQSFEKIKTVSNIYQGPFSEGLAKGKSSYGNTIVYFDKKGNYFSVQNASEGGDFHNGRAYIKDFYSTRYYFIDKTGKKIDNNLYDAVANFSDEMAVVRNGNKIGFVDTTGKLVIPYKYDLATNFYNGISMVKEGNLYYTINKKGKHTTNDTYNGALDQANGTFPVKKGTKFGLIDDNGKTIVDFKYEEISPMYEGVVWAKNNGKWGMLVDKKPVTDFKYDGFNNFKNGYSKVSINNKVGLVDRKGNEVIEPIYDKTSDAFKDNVLLINEAGNKIFSVQ
ncbi:MAG: WG repeat-containing protein [Bacteroidetes bacterium]|nr:WG repeat-containing protein [Bacteroidota bacterium]